MLANLVYQALCVPEALLVLGNQTHAAGSISGFVVIYRDGGLRRATALPAVRQLRIQLFLDRNAHSTAEQPIFSRFFKALNIGERLSRIAVAYVHDEGSHLRNLGFRKAFSDRAVIGFWQESFGQGDTSGSA